MDYGDLKDLAKRLGSQSIKIRLIKHLILLKVQNNDRHQGGIVSIVYKFFDKKIAAHNGTGTNFDGFSDKQQLAE